MNKITVSVDINIKHMSMIGHLYWTLLEWQEGEPEKILTVYPNRMMGNHMITIQISLEYYRLLDKYKMVDK